MAWISTTDGSLRWLDDTFIVPGRRVVVQSLFTRRLFIYYRLLALSVRLLPFLSLLFFL